MHELDIERQKNKGNKGGYLHVRESLEELEEEAVDKV